MYILASGSPRRRELITHITNDFSVDIPVGEEICPQDITVEERPEYLARQKAAEIAEKHGNETVIAADTAVFLEGEMLGKPRDAEDAFSMLKKLSGNTHHVITGCAIKKGEKEVSFSVKTSVTFYSLTDAEITEYIATGEPLDKAGAYGVQGKGALLVKEIRGDYFNVVGFPIAELARNLKNF